MLMPQNVSTCKEIQADSATQGNALSPSNFGASECTNFIETSLNRNRNIPAEDLLPTIV
jgi:hypothetical protein